VSGSAPASSSRRNLKWLVLIGVIAVAGAEHPFFVMWVDNAELLCKW
jgi:hypothetical protein